MVNSCVAFNCTNRQGMKNDEGTLINFHRFPWSNETMLNKWIQAIHRKNWEPTKYSYVCSEHFQIEDYKENQQKKMLKSSSVPSIFKFSNHLLKKGKKRTLGSRPSPSKAINSSVSNNDPESLEITPDIVMYDPLPSPIISLLDAATQCNLPTAKELHLRRKLKINQQRLKRRDKKISTMKRLIMNLKKLKKERRERLKKQFLANGSLVAVLTDNFNDDFIKVESNNMAEVAPWGPFPQCQ